MATINPATVTDGETIDASDLNNPIATIADEINGNLDSENLANNAVTTAKIAAGAVTPNSLLASTGSSWEWQSWTPTFSFGTVGNSTVAGKYMQVGKTVTFKMRFIRGSSGSIDNGFGFEPPVPAHGDYITDFNNAFIGVAAYKDDSTGSRYTGPIFINSLTRFRPQFHDGGTIDAISATYPFTDATGDELFCTGTYEAA